MNSQDPLSQPLKLAADATRPPFSQALHTSILDALAQERLVVLSDSPMQSPHATRWIAWGTACSVACVLLVGLAVLRQTDEPQAPPPSLLSVPSELPALSPESIDQVTMVTTEWDDLNHDVIAATQWWIDEVPLNSVLE